MPYKFNPFTGSLDETGATGATGATGTVSAAGAGTAAAPSISFAADTNTGIYSPGEDQLAVATNGTGRLFIDATGNVGVGLSSPSYPLEVASSTNSTINITGGTSNSCRLFFSDTALARGFINYDHADDSINIGTAGSERLRITSAGLVGIGTSSPQTLLELSASNSSIPSGDPPLNILRFNDTDTGTAGGQPTGRIEFYVNDAGAGGTGVGSFIEGAAGGSTGGGRIRFGTSNSGATGASTKVVIDDSGFVGIGTSSPSAILSTKPSASSTTGATTFTGDGLFIDCANTTDGNGNYGGAISWSRSGSSTTRAAAITNVQTANDADIQGLAFLTHNSSTSTNPLIEAMRITGAGNVGIGVTGPQSPLHVNGTGDVAIQITNGTTGTAATDGSQITVEDPSMDLVLRNRENATIRFLTNNTERGRFDASGRLLVGTSSANANGGILQLSSGITFPATAVAATDANTLDDYEEGTWTPTLGGTATYTFQNATYTKVGRQVTVNCYLDVIAIGTGSTSLISGLPFTVGTFAPASGAVSRLGASAVNVTSLQVQLSGTTVTTVGMTVAGSMATQNVFGSNTAIYFTAVYFV